ncbi:MAG: hag 3 [Fibrobacteres bacterium]|nr:hag 3 [Fibrobacterota bacterium]
MRIEKHQHDQLANRFQATGKEKAKVLEQLATGKRLNRASDDPAGMAVAMEFDKQVRAYRNAAENIQAGMSALAIADGGASTISEMLQRQQELAIQSANGAYGQDQRDALDKEFQALSSEIDRISKSTEFNGQKLLDGTGKLADGTGSIQAGDGADDAVTIHASDLSLNALNLASEKLDSPQSALKAMSAIDGAMKRLNDTRADQGSTINRFEFALSNNQTQSVAATQSLSNVQDLDYAKGLTEKVRTDILQDSQGAAMTQFNQLTRSHLLALLQ